MLEAMLAEQVEPQSMPPTLLVTRPPDPACTASVNDVGDVEIAENAAETDRACDIDTVQTAVPEQPPVHPSKRAPEAGWTARVTVDDDGKFAVHVPTEQLIPAGLLVTVPEPLTMTVRANCDGAGLDDANAAETLFAASMVTVQDAVPVQAPDQPLKTKPMAEVAVSVTCVPLANDAEHDAPQLMPLGALVTVPPPCVDDTDSAYDTGAGLPLPESEEAVVPRHAASCADSATAATMFRRTRRSNIFQLRRTNIDQVQYAGIVPTEILRIPYTINKVLRGVQILCKCDLSNACR